jgi:hypothetical protein
LEYTAKDAEAIGNIFERQCQDLYKSIEVKTLTNEDAKITNIIKNLAWLKEKATQNDVVIIYLATYGFREANKYYLLPYGGAFDDYQGTSLYWSDVIKTLGEIPAQVSLFLNTKHKTPASENIFIENTEAVRKIVSAENGVNIIMPTGIQENTEQNKTLGHTSFAYSIIQSLENKDDKLPNGNVSLEKLSNIASSKIEELTSGKQFIKYQKAHTVGVDIPIICPKK